MSARSEHDDDGNETEMSGLQSNGRPSQESGAHLRKDPERQDQRRSADQNPKAAYRKLYAILTIMTMLLFALNIAQVCLLPVMSSLYWIVLFPGIIFLVFIAWAWYFIAANYDVFFGHVGTFKEGRRRTFQHLGALFFLRSRSERSYHYGSSEPSWPMRLQRAGVFLTIFLNIIFCQFIYLPVFAIPAFKEITWKIGLNSSQSVTTPSFALFSNTELSRQAILETNTTSIQQMCDLKMDDPVFTNLYCFKDPETFSYGDQNKRHARYVTLNGSQHPIISRGTNMGLWYQYYYNGTASKDPLLSLIAFDTVLLPQFEHAFKCGIITATPFPAGDRVQANLHQITINDQYNDMGRTDECKKAFKHYNMFEIDIIPLGAPSAPGPYNCDITDDTSPRANGSCNADVTVSFPSTLTRVYTSEHGKNWITILTEEGGVVGFVMFLTWFFGIFHI